MWWRHLDLWSFWVGWSLMRRAGVEEKGHKQQYKHNIWEIIRMILSIIFSIIWWHAPQSITGHLKLPEASHSTLLFTVLIIESLYRQFWEFTRFGWNQPLIHMTILCFWDIHENFPFHFQICLSIPTHLQPGQFPSLSVVTLSVRDRLVSGDIKC